jgi:hypothetical protein
MKTFDSLQNRWLEFRPTKTQAFWLAAGCVAATLVLGFSAAGWKTAGNAQAEVAKAAQEARQELAAAVCVDEFMAAADAGARLARLQKATFYDRSDNDAKGGFATMPDREEPSSSVAIMCASRLGEVKPQTAAAH